MTISICLENTLTERFVIDDIDASEVLKYLWHIHVDQWTSYVVRWTYDSNGNRYKIHLHRQLLNADNGVIVDHRNHDGLDNTRQNIRAANGTQSNANRKKWSNTSSKYKGVSHRKDKKARPWQAYIRFEGVLQHLGFYSLEVDAAKAYNDKALELFGEFACLNVL